MDSSLEEGRQTGQERPFWLSAYLFLSIRGFLSSYVALSCLHSACQTNRHRHTWQQIWQRPRNTTPTHPDPNTNPNPKPNITLILTLTKTRQYNTIQKEWSTEVTPWQSHEDRRPRQSDNRKQNKNTATVTDIKNYSSIFRPIVLNILISLRSTARKTADKTIRCQMSEF